MNRELSVPWCVYDNPTTTRVRFSNALLGRVAALPHVVSIKIPGVPTGPGQAAEHIARLRTVLPADVTLGVSGDVHAVPGPTAGCDLWYAVLAGVLPRTCRAIVDAVAAGDDDRARELADRLQPVWDLFAEHGSVRVVSALVELLGIVSRVTLPRPSLPLAAALGLLSAAGPVG